MNETIFNYGIETEQPKNYKAEGEEFIKKLTGSKKYCLQFFFDTEVKDKKGNTKKKACQIDSLRSKMIYDLKKDYNVDVKPQDISTIVYLTLWADGTWLPLNSFEGRSSFFAWMKKVAKNAVIERLVEEHLIDDVRSRSVGNTRLALRSQSPTKCKMVIDDLMVGSKYHSILTAIYVDRLSKKDIMKKQNLNDAEFETAKKQGENWLKDALLRSTEFSEENILRDKTKHVVMVSTDYAADLHEWCKAKAGASPLTDVFGTDLTEEEIREKTVDFLYDFSTKLEWSDQDRYIWCRRFIVNADPEGLAVEVGHSRAWVDTRFSRLNKTFKSEIKKWWYSHAA